MVLYHLSYLDIIQMYPGHVRQIHHDYDNGIQWRDKYNGTFEGMSWTYMWDSLNSPKTHETENQGHKLFTALGALNLKNWLVTNYTTLMNNIRDTLNNSINTKLSHGGYNNTAQQLKNEIDTKFPSSEAWINYFKESGDTSALVDKLLSPGQYQCGANRGTYHLSYINVYEMYPGHIRQVREHWNGGSAWREIYRTGNPDFTNVGWNFYLDTKNINERYCPYRVGDILTTTIPSNPGEVWSGTGWEKIEGCFLYAHNSAGDRGGENTVYLNVGHLPPHNHGSGYIRHNAGDGEWDWRPSTSNNYNDGRYHDSDTVGSGAGINNMPSYYTVHVWKRIV
ncbi:hypothetical protein MKD34_09145 (plasmid) [Cetobacterium somerae]|uniref:phage baseplate protein n=1 Tax=Cetobacterium somerae TaxID=188913 RepID=UPI001F05D7E9|nr:hypothetical protein [Cetobacterium somerae]UPO98438.1 hypothetical protein MKD34_09145 [Cetobacterium somerae]